jgi:hypothetical protein
MAAMIFGVWQVNGENVPTTAPEKPKRRSRKPLVVLRNKLYPDNLPRLQDINEQIEAKGLKLADIFGRRLAVKIKVGKRTKIKSFRLFEAEYINMCDCCGPSTWMKYRFNGRDFKGFV